MGIRFLDLGQSALGAERLLKYTAPSSKGLFIDGAYRIDAGFVSRLQQISRRYIGEDTRTVFTFVMKNEQEHSTESTDELGELPLHHARTRKEFRVEIFTNDEKYPIIPKISCRFRFSGNDSTVYLYISKISNLAECAQSLGSFIREERTWYNILYPGWFIALPPLCIGGLLGSIPWIGISGNNFALLSSGIWAALAILWLIRLLMFDRVAVIFGSGLERESRLVTVRRIFFGSVITASLLAIINGASSGYFSSIFERK